MLKGKYIGLCAVALISAAVLAGCGGKEPSERESADGEGYLTEESQKEGHLTKESPEEGSTEESYPKIAKLPADKWIQLVMYSEGCYCIFDGSYYGFMTEEGEEITPYIYEQAAPFSEGLACVFLDGKYGFIGKDGETELPFIYDQASSFTEGLAYFRMGEDYGFIDHEGNVVLRPDCDSVSSFREGRAYFSVDGLYGYLDKSGRIVVEPVYEDAGYFWDGLAMVMRNGCYGVMGIEGEEVLPPEYDDIDIEDGFIIAEKDGLKYCFDREGRQYLKEGWDSIGVCEGVFRVWRNDKIGLIDSDGNVIHSGEYKYVTQYGSCYEVNKDGKYGFLNEQGEQLVPADYDYCSSYRICGASNVFSMESCSEGVSDYLVKTEEGEETGLSEIFLQNHITPRAKEYMEFLQNGVWGEGQDYTLNLSELDEPSRNLSKLYRMGGELVLYFYAEPYEETGFPLSSSGFFVFRDGKMEQLAAGYECGGSSRGDHICFWYDKAESGIRLGMSEAAGGFGGFAYGGTVYELQSKGAEVITSWLCVSQTSGNYDREELLENAELFYDDYGNAYTGETIPEAEYVTEYEVNGERTSIERYEEIRDRYRYMSALD